MRLYTALAIRCTTSPFLHSPMHNCHVLAHDLANVDFNRYRELLDHAVSPGLTTQNAEFLTTMKMDGFSFWKLSCE
jgi:hypothetical protein